MPTLVPWERRGRPFLFASLSAIALAAAAFVRSGYALDHILVTDIAVIGLGFGVFAFAMVIRSVMVMVLLAIVLAGTAWDCASTCLTRPGFLDLAPQAVGRLQDRDRLSDILRMVALFTGTLALAFSVARPRSR